jgi:hypothetical protein
MTTIIPGRGKAIARAVLAAADRAKVDQLLIRTVQKGYSVPDKVAAEYLKSQKGADKSEAKPAAKKAPAKSKAKAEAKTEDVATQEVETQETGDSNDPEKGD